VLSATRFKFGIRQESWLAQTIAKAEDFPQAQGNLNCVRYGDCEANAHHFLKE
jgi:hypothetical protein